MKAMMSWCCKKNHTNVESLGEPRFTNSFSLVLSVFFLASPVHSGRVPGRDQSHTLVQNCSEDVIKYHNEMMATNEDLVKSYKIRLVNTSEIQLALKRIHGILYNASRLRGK